MSSDHESLQAIAKDWAGLTQQGRVLISIDRPKSGQPLTEIVGHERAHSSLIRDTALGWLLNVLSTFGLHPWPAGDVRDRCHALLSVVAHATQWTHEGLATFLAGVALEDDAYAQYRSRQPSMYLRASAVLDGLRGRDLSVLQKANLALTLAALASGVPVLERWEADGLTDVDRARAWFSEAVNRPDARFPALCRTLTDLTDAQLVDLAAQPYAPAAEVMGPLVQLDGAVPEFRLMPEHTGLDDILAIARTVTAPLLDDPTLSERARGQLAHAMESPALALQGLAPPDLSILMTRTRGDVGRYVRDPAHDDLVGYEMVRVQYNVSFDVEPGLTPSGAEPLPLLPREAVCYFSAPGREPLAATFSAFEFLDWLDALDGSLTLSVHDTSYLTLGGTPPHPLAAFVERRHVVFVVGRTPHALVLDVSASCPSGVRMLVTVNASDIVGVSYVMLRREDQGSPVIIMPTVADSARAMVNLLGSTGGGQQFPLVPPEQFFPSRESVIDFTRVIADFEGRDDFFGSATPSAT
jgi:hypothetical protein